MGLTTDDMMIALAKENNMRILNKPEGGIYKFVRLQGKKRCMVGDPIQVFLNEKTGILTCSEEEDKLVASLNKILMKLTAEYFNDLM